MILRPPPSPTPRYIYTHGTFKTFKLEPRVFVRHCKFSF